MSGRHQPSIAQRAQALIVQVARSHRWISPLDRAIAVEQYVSDQMTITLNRLETLRRAEKDLTGAVGIDEIGTIYYAKDI